MSNPMKLTREHINNWMEQFDVLASDTGRNARFEINPNGKCRVTLFGKLGYEGTNIDKAIQVYNRETVNV